MLNFQVATLLLNTPRHVEGRDRAAPRAGPRCASPAEASFDERDLSLDGVVHARRPVHPVAERSQIRTGFG
jgi:hypothetical protein